MADPLLRLGAARVSNGSVTVAVHVDPARMRTTDVPQLAGRAFETLPLLVGHACDNADGLSIRDEFRDTEVAHLVEHVAVELLARVEPERTLRGRTAWDFSRDGRGVFQVTVHHPDPHRALVAIREAGRLVEEWSRGSGGQPASAVAAVRECRSADPDRPS